MGSTVESNRLVSGSGVAFRVAGIPVLVRWSHLILIGFVTWPLPLVVFYARGLAGRALASMAMIPLAVLIHELGHALVARRFGGSPRMELILFGGLTYPMLPASTSAGRHALVSVAGPLAGMAAGGIVAVSARVVLDEFVFAEPAGVFVWVSLVWGIFNLVPLPSLDGGHVLTYVAEAIWGPRGVRWATVAKVVTAAVVLVAVWRWLGSYSALWILLILGPAAVQELRSGWSEPDRDQLSGAFTRYREGGDFQEVLNTAVAVRSGTRSEQLREGARYLMVLTYAALGRWQDVVGTADPEAMSERLPLARAFLALDRPAEAEGVARDVDTRTGRLLVAAALAAQDLGHLIEFRGPEEAPGAVDFALALMNSGEEDVGRSLSEALAMKNDVPADVVAVALLQIDRFVPAEVVERMSPGGRWMLDRERSVRTGEALVSGELPEPGIHTDWAFRLQSRLHHLGFLDEAAVLGHTLLDVVEPGWRSPVGYALARTLARLGRPESALTMLETHVELVTGEMLADPDLAEVRHLPGWAEFTRRDGGSLRA